MMELNGVYGRASWTVGIRSLLLELFAWDGCPLLCGAAPFDCHGPAILLLSVLLQLYWPYRRL